MGKAGLAIILLIMLVASAIYATGLGDDFVKITGDAVKEIFEDAREIIKEKTIGKLSAAEDAAEKKLGNTIGDDKIKINLTNPLTGDKIEYSCEKGD